MPNEEICRKCGNHISKHEIDPYSGRRTKCPVYRAEPEGKGGEFKPRSDY